MLVAKADGDNANIRFVACSGATTGSSDDQSPFSTGGSLIKGSHGERSQLNALSPNDTKIVSLTVGGDDLGFSTLLSSCVGLKVQEGPVSYEVSSLADYSSPGVCARTLAEAQKIATAAPGADPSLESALEDTYSRILGAAPQATLYVLAYPQLLTTARVSSFCPLTGAGHVGPFTVYLGLTSARVTALNGLESDLNADIKSAAQEVNQSTGSHRVVVVSVNSLTRADGQTCNTKTMSRSIINGILFAPGDSISTVFGDCVRGNAALILRCIKTPQAAFNNSISKGSIHPKPAGQALMAKALEAAIASTPPGVTWSAPLSIDPGSQLNSVSCTSSSFCMAADGSGNVLAFNGTSWTSPLSIDPGNRLNSVSCTSSSFCMAADGSGKVLAFNGTSWSAPLSIDPGNQLTSVSCTSSNFCMAADTSGIVLAFNGTSWSNSESTGNLLSTVSCASPSFCAAVGNAGPGGSAFIFNGTSWSSGDLVDPGYKLHSVSCPSASFCTAGASVNAFSYNADTWSSAVSIDANDGNGVGLGSVSCPSTSFCSAIDAIGNAIAFSGTTWSAPIDIDASIQLNSVSCPSSLFCAAVDDSGNVLTMRS
jgi:hypothetical protein